MAALTLSQFVNTVRERHNAVGDDHWSDDEIYQLLTNRLNEAISYTGLIDFTSTASSVASTQAYTLPTTCVYLQDVDYNYRKLRRIDFAEWDAYRSYGTGTPEGTPDKYYVFGNSIYLIPTPATAIADAIRYWGKQEHPFIDNSSQLTIDFPAHLVPHLGNGVISDMFAKDLNQGMATFYENMWTQKGIPAFQRWRAFKDNASNFSHITSSDTEQDSGVVY